jgi:hypothetical protein
VKVVVGFVVVLIVLGVLVVTEFAFSRFIDELI